MKSTLNRLDSVHQRLLAAVGKIDPQLFSARPADSEWSVAEVIHHLCLAEERVLSDLGKNLEDPASRVGLLKRMVPMRIVSWRLIRVKAPKAVQPREVLPQDELIRSYNQVRARLKQFCAKHSRERLRKVSFRHPFLGHIDGVATISMVAFHEQRHFKQIREILKKLEKAAG